MLTPASGVPTVRRLTEPVLDDVVVPPRSDQLSLALWDRFRSGTAFARAGSEVVIGTKHLVPSTRRPTLLVVHDVLTITRAHENALAKRLLLPAQYRSSLTRASRLVAVSAATRTRLGALDPAWERKCDVVPNGMSRHLLEAVPDPIPSLADQPFALVVGDLSPRKNLGLLTRLWVGADPPALTLVVVGPDAGGDDRARAELSDLERAGRAVWIRDADDARLRWCYEQARVVLFPTHEEGFGLPLLEAMTFRAPVLASSDLALREVAAGAAGVVHLDAGDPAAWGRALTAAAGRTRAPLAPRVPEGAITWDEHTDRLLAVARELARGARV